MFYVLDGEYPQESIIYQTDNEREAQLATKFYYDKGYQKAHWRKQTREELNHLANIFANNQ
jgi:hypothetical protein